MSWGNKLVMAFVAFTALIGTLVYKAVHTRYDLVTAKYYEDELKYEDHITAVKNTAKLGDVEVTQDATTVTIALPKEMNGYAVEGNAWFYYKTNAVNDRLQAFTTNTGTISFAKKALPQGKNVLLKLNWKTGTENYYAEKTINL